MTLSGIWGSYFYDASHTIRESSIILILSVYPCDTSLHVCHSTLCIIFCTFGETQTHILWSVATGSVLLNYEGMLCVWWGSNPWPLEPQSSTLPTELHTPYNFILLLWLIQYVLTQFESIRWGIAILDLRSDNVRISQLIFVLAIPFLL